MCQNVKNVSMCQKCVNKSKVKKSNSLTMDKAKKLDMMMLRHNEVNFDVTHESHQNWSKTHENFKSFDDHYVGNEK